MRLPFDTSPEIRERQLAAYRAMSPEARLRLADELSAAVRALATAGASARGRLGPSEAEIEADLAAIPGGRATPHRRAPAP